MDQPVTHEVHRGLTLLQRNVTEPGLVASSFWMHLYEPNLSEPTGKLVDTELGGHIDVLSTGRFPGDDKPKPIAFPDPATTAIRGAPFALLPVERWIELKLASGMVAPHRLKDLVDVQELIRVARLPRAMAEDLDTWVRAKFRELWDAVDSAAKNDPY